MQPKGFQSVTASPTRGDIHFFQTYVVNLVYQKTVISQQVLNAIGDNRIFGKDGPLLPGYNHNSGQRTQ